MLINLELDLAVFLAPLVLFALAKTESVWFRPFMNDIARVLGAIPIIGSRLANAVVAIEANLRHYLGQQVLAVEQPVVRWLRGAGTFITQLFYTATNAAIESGRAVEQLAHLLEREVAVPAKVTVRKVTRTVYRIDKKTTAAIAAAVAAIEAVKHTATVAIPRGIEGEIADLRGYVNRKADQLAKSIQGEVRKVAIGALAAGVVWAAIRRLKLGWLKCGAVNKVGRALCGASGLIETLFSDAIEAFLVTDLCRFIHALSGAARAFQPLLISFVDVEDVLIGCHGATKPELVNVPALSLPPVTGLVTQ